MEVPGPAHFRCHDVLEAIHAENGQNTYHCFVANRLSYFFDLQGPSISYDSACSSGLAALQAGCDDKEIPSSWGSRVSSHLPRSTFLV